MRDFFTALALVFVIEGVFLALMPHRLRQIVELLEQMAPDALRAIGLGAAASGVVAVWLLRG